MWQNIRFVLPASAHNVAEPICGGVKLMCVCLSPLMERVDFINSKLINRQ